MGLFDFLKKPADKGNAGIILQPIDGEIIPLEDIGDGVFSEGILGQGCGLKPTAEAVYAPMDATVTTVAETLHAVGLEGNGVEMLIHVGLETVSMNGAGFDMKVKEGQKVKAGDLLFTFSMDEINKAEGVSTTSAVLVTNSDDLPKFKVLRTGDGKVGDQLFQVK